MPLSSNYLFLLFLLLVILLPAFLWRVARGHATGVTNLNARVPNLFLNSRAQARASRSISQAPTPHGEQSHTTMSNLPLPRRDESDRWKALIFESEAAVKKYLFPQINIDLATFIRCVAFRVFVVVFLDVDPNPLEFTKVQLVTGAISEFYNDRQGKSTLPPDVQNILNEWLPRKRFPSSLDRILPAYEALWRIIATIVVTCEDDDTKSLRWVMLDFRDNPRDRQYSVSFGSDGKSVSEITDDVVGRLTPIARPQHRATSSNWPLSCIQYATSGRAVDGHPPTVREALKFAALLASMVIGRVGVHYGISDRGDGVAGSQASPWDQRKIFGIINGVPDHLTIDMFPHASTSRQAY